MYLLCFFKQKTAYDMRISDWSSDVCSSDLTLATRSQWSMNVLHDRAPLYITLSDGSLRNGYTVKVLNKTRDVRDLHLALDGLPQAAMFYAGDGAEVSASLALEAAAHAVYDVREIGRGPGG